MDTIGLVDERNIDLWKNLNDDFAIEIEYTNVSEYGCFTRNKTAIIYVSKHNRSSDYFTHELLHVLLNKKKIYLGGSLRRRIGNDETLKTIISDDLISHISNSLEHVKMLPIFLSLGYNREKFILDYKTDKCTLLELAVIKNYYKNFGALRQYAVDLYIGKFFAIKADPNTDNDYSERLDVLSTIDSDLYEILENFFRSWLEYDIDNDDIFNDYYTLLNDFLIKLTSWAIR